MKIILAQQNYHIGNFESNTNKIIDAIKFAKNKNADLVVFSEMSVCGYTARDFVDFNDFINKCYESIDVIKQHADTIGVIVGAPDRNPVYFVRADQNWRSIGASPNDYVNQPIHRADGVMLGTVRDLLVRPDGTTAAAVLSVGRQLGIGEKEVAVPISILRMERRENGLRVVVDVEKDALLSAPSYEGTR